MQNGSLLRNTHRRPITPLTIIGLSSLSTDRLNTMAIQTVHTHLQNATAPWSSLLVVPAGTTPSSLVKPPAGFALRQIHGKKCGTAAGVFNEFARALDFPDYFGHNW